MVIVNPNKPADRYISRRGILIGAAASLVCAPSIVRATSLMPIKGVILPIDPIVPRWAGYIERLRYDWMEKALKRGWDEERDGRTFGCGSEDRARKAVAYAHAQGWLKGFSIVGS